VKTSQKAKRRHTLFAQEYCVDLNATRAYIAAGYSRNGAEQGASTLLRNRKVAKLIEELLSRRATKLEISGEKVLERYEAMAEGNVADFVSIGEDGAARIDLQGKSRAELYCIQKISTDTYVTGAGNAKRVVTTVKLELADRLKANESLAKYKKLFADSRVEVIGLAGLSDEELQSRLKALEEAH
jgi:phage terminase small subunit